MSVLGAPSEFGTEFRDISAPNNFDSLPSLNGGLSVQKICPEAQSRTSSLPGFAIQVEHLFEPIKTKP